MKAENEFGNINGNAKQINEKRIVILIATHKKYPMPEDDIYLPLHVGREGKPDLGYTGDNTGDNISEKNASWCELTGLYWGWKNLDCDYLGLVQYRRHFMYKRKKRRCHENFSKKPECAEERNANRHSKDRRKGVNQKKFDSILTHEEAKLLLSREDIVLPKKRNYRVDTLEEHFNGYDFSENTDLMNLRRIIHTLSPEYDDALETVMKRHSGHMCNMFLMKKELADAFCEWEFTVLGEFEKTIAPERKRMVGYVAEHMLDIWIEKNGYDYVECGVALLDRGNEVARRVDYLMRKLGIPFRMIR